MSGKTTGTAGPFGVSAPMGRLAPARPAIRRRPPAPAARAHTGNRNEFEATGPQLPLHPVTSGGSHPASPPAPNAAFEALMVFTEMLEREMVDAEARALAHGREWKPPFSGALEPGENS
jgi:hypothetical protein